MASETENVLERISEVCQKYKMPAFEVGQPPTAEFLNFLGVSAEQYAHFETIPDAALDQTVLALSEDPRMFTPDASLNREGLEAIARENLDTVEQAEAFLSVMAGYVEAEKAMQACVSQEFAALSVQSADVPVVSAAVSAEQAEGVTR